MKDMSVRASLIAVFAALQVLLSTLPLSVTIGIAGTITLGVIGGPLIGILIGPVLGGLAVLVGSLVGCFINPAGAIFGFLTVMPPLFGAISAGCVRTRKGYVGGAVILASLIAFYAHEFGRQASIYPWLHIIAMIIAFSPLSLIAGSAFESSSYSKIFYGAVTAAFVGVMADHIVGSAIAIWYFNLPPAMWYMAMPVYPIERIIALIIASIIATPIYYRLKRIGLLQKISL